MSSLERQLFDWENWDSATEGAYFFYKVTLKVPIGQFSAGTEFHSALVDFSNSQLELYPDKSETHYTFELKISV